jgi:O-antigen ligase
MKSKSIIKDQNSNKAKILLIGSCFVTLFINPSIADPINSPKMWALLLLSSYLLGPLVIATIRNFKTEDIIYKIFFGLCLLFGTSLLFATINTENIQRAIFGETQRRNGLLSYFALIIISISASLFVRKLTINLFYTVISCVTLLLTTYGLFQHYGQDLISWDNPYNSVIGTLGNPNFMAAILGMFGTICFSSLLIKSIDYRFKLLMFLLGVFCLTIIMFSNSRQGLINLLLGIWLVLLLFFYKRKRYIYILFLAVTIPLLIVMFLGMLQRGPFQNYVYKDSVSIRGFYWRAAVNMFLQSPISGIGIDSYGLYFKEFREIAYPLRFGFELTSNSAHNVYLQMFATGGIFLGLFYLTLLLFVFVTGIRSLKYQEGNNYFLLLSLIGSWFSFQAQSLISIDNLGVSVWGWLLSGLIIAKSVEGRTESMKKSLEIRENYRSTNRKISSDYMSLQISSVFLVSMVFLISFSYQNERNLRQVYSTYNPNSISQSIDFKEYAIGALEIKFNDNNYKASILNLLNEGPEKDFVFDKLNNYLINDKRNLILLESKAAMHEKYNETSKAVETRIQISKYDQWNCQNYLKLLSLYKKSDDLINARLMKAKIISIAPNTEISQKATEILS